MKFKTGNKENRSGPAAGGGARSPGDGIYRTSNFYIPFLPITNLDVDREAEGALLRYKGVNRPKIP